MLTSGKTCESWTRVNNVLRLKEKRRLWAEKIERVLVDGEPCLAMATKIYGIGSCTLTNLAGEIEKHANA